MYANIQILSNSNSENVNICVESFEKLNDPEKLDNNLNSMFGMEMLENEFEKDDTLNSYRTCANETLLISDIPNILLDDENTILALGEGKTPFSLTNDNYCKELAHPHLFPTGKFGYKADRDIKLSPTKYFNQRL